MFVVDSHALIYQVFHALPEMTGPAGNRLGRFMGFVRTWCDLLIAASAGLFDLRV